MQPLHQVQVNSDADDKELNNGDQQWVCPFEDSVDYTGESEKWHAFLNHLYCQFSGYEIQLAKRTLSSINSKDSAEENCKIQHLLNKGQSSMIDKNNFQRFLTTIKNCNIPVNESLKNITVSEFELEQINRILNITLKERIHVSCKGLDIFIKGHYVTTLDIIGTMLLLKHNAENNSCKDIILTNSEKSLKIFALNTYFINAHMNSVFKNMFNIGKIVVIAPKWEIIDTESIQLNGENGNLPEVSNGENGNPGKPGKPGGNFFGIGNKYLNGKNLTISVDGGKGSNGQNGKNGENGKDGSTPSVPSGVKCEDDLCDKNKQINLFHCENVKCNYQYLWSHYGVYNKQVTSCDYKIFGDKGTKGMMGGKGGKGGKGGFPGNIAIIELNSPSGILQLTNSGQDGKNGKGGLGGIGGKRGNDIIVSCEQLAWRRVKWSLYNTTDIFERAESGQNGPDGVNTVGMEKPKAAAVMKNLYKAKTVNQYKSYLRENINDSFLNVLLTQFLNHLEGSNEVKTLYDTLSLIDDLINLEGQFLKLNKDVNFHPFYESLLNRISEYAENPKDEGDLNTYKKVLSFLYAATLGRKYNLEDNLESNLIIDISAYLKFVKTDIDKLKDLQNTKFKVDVINKYKKKYKSEIDVKIEEAKEYVRKEITPEVDNITTDVNIQIGKLISEVISLKDKTRKEHEKLSVKQQQLENALVIQGLLSSVNILGNVVSLLVRAGTITSSMMEIGSTLPKPFISHNEDGQTDMLQLSQSVSELNMLNNQIKSITGKKVTHLKMLLEQMAEEINKHPDNLRDLSLKIADIKRRLEAVDFTKFNVLEIQVFEKEIEATLEAQERKIVNDQSKNLTNHDGTKKYDSDLAVIKNLKNIFQLNTFLFDTYNTYKSNQEKIDTITKAIKQNEHKFLKIKQYEQNIYSIIIPMLQNMQNGIEDVMNKLGTNSKIALDATKWRLKSSLRDLRLHLQQMTKGFEVQDNLARSIEKLEESMITLINMYDYIQDFQEDQNLATLIAAISSISVADINIANNPNVGEALRNSVRELEIMVRSSIVLQRYKVAMDAFKQFVFPFAHTYLGRLMLPTLLQLNDGENNIALDTLIFRATNQIDEISTKLEEYKTSVYTYDQCSAKGEFKSRYVSSKPFFAWKNEQYKKMISKLLAGEDVIVTAGIRNSDPFKDAMRFNIAEFHFKSKNETVQSEINNKLKRFKLTATHLGNSHYRYDGKIYQMKTASQTIWYYFERKPNGDPLDNSISYEKIKKGNCILSPYATWKIKLDNVIENISFKDLEMYNDVVDLELEGKACYIDKRIGNCKELMVEKYYKPIDVDNKDDINIGLNEVYNQHALEEKAQNRFKSEINEKLDNGELVTYDEGNEYSKNNFENTEYVNINTKPNSWFSWIRLPNFRNLEETRENLEVKTESQNMEGNIWKKLTNGIKIFKDMFISGTPNTIDGTVSEKISNTYSDYILKEEPPKGFYNLAVDFDSNGNSSAIQMLASFNVNENLALGQLVVYKMFGSNKSINGIYYISPEEEQQLRINNLASVVLPTLNKDSLNDNKYEDFIKNYKISPRWYKDLYKDEFDEMQKQN